MSAVQRRAAIAAVLARGVVRWRAGVNAVGVTAGLAGDATSRERVSEISRDSLGERLDPRSIPSLSVDDERRRV